MSSKKKKTDPVSPSPVKRSIEVAPKAPDAETRDQSPDVPLRTENYDKDSPYKFPVVLLENAKCRCGSEDVRQLAALGWESLSETDPWDYNPPFRRQMVCAKCANQFTHNARPVREDGSTVAAMDGSVPMHDWARAILGRSAGSEE